MPGRKAHGVHKGVQAAVLNIADGSRLEGLVEVRQLHAVKAVGLFNGGQDLFRRLGGNLAAVGAVDLVAVILGGVVAGGDADSRAAVQIPHRPAEGRGGLQAGIEVRGNPIGGQDPGGLPGEQVPLNPAVPGDGHGLGQVRAVQVVRQPLGGPADGVEVHAVGARAGDAPESPGAKGQTPMEIIENGE